MLFSSFFKVGKKTLKPFGDDDKVDLSAKESLAQSDNSFLTKLKGNK